MGILPRQILGVLPAPGHKTLVEPLQKRAPIGRVAANILPLRRSQQGRVHLRQSLRKVLLGLGGPPAGKPWILHPDIVPLPANPGLLTCGPDPDAVIRLDESI